MPRPEKCTQFGISKNRSLQMLVCKRKPCVYNNFTGSVWFGCALGDVESNRWSCYPPVRGCGNPRGLQSSPFGLLSTNRPFLCALPWCKGIGILRANRYNVPCPWGVAKRQGSGLWIRHRWFESIHPSQIQNRTGKPDGFLFVACRFYRKTCSTRKGVLCAK